MTATFPVSGVRVGVPMIVVMMVRQKLFLQTLDANHIELSNRRVAIHSTLESPATPLSGIGRHREHLLIGNIGLEMNFEVRNEDAMRTAVDVSRCRASRERCVAWLLILSRVWCKLPDVWPRHEHDGWVPFYVLDALIQSFHSWRFFRGSDLKKNFAGGLRGRVGHIEHRDRLEQCKHLVERR